MFLLIPAGISEDDKAGLRRRFEDIHDQDIEAALKNRITKITSIPNKNVGHQQPTNADKSILDEPFSITDILKSLDKPRAAKFIKELPDTASVAYRRVYEFFFDQFIGKRYLDHGLDCKFLTVVLVNSNNRTYCESGGKNICLLSFSCNKEETLPIKRDGFSSNENEIVKIWAENQLNHRDYLVSQESHRPLDSRKLGAPFYNNCRFPGCYSCDSDSPEENDSVGYPAGATSSGTESAASTPFNQPNSGGYPAGNTLSTTFQQTWGPKIMSQLQNPPPHHFQPPRTLIPENHSLQEQNETVKNSTEIEKPPPYPPTTLTQDDK